MTETQLEKKTLREWREELGLTQRELGELVGVHDQSVSALEKGDVSLASDMAQRILCELSIERKQILSPTLNIMPDFSIDGLSDMSPRKPLRWWRERRGLTTQDLARISSVSDSTIANAEGFRSRRRKSDYVRPATRRKIAVALRVRLDKIVFLGDTPDTPEQQSNESLLRADNRELRKALKRYYEFVTYDPNISLRSLDARDSLLRDTERELRGL